jgi:hypothetical protein
MESRMTRKTTNRRPKTSQAREYTGPNTLEDVKKFWESNATQKAKVKAAEALPDEDQLELVEWARKRALTAVEAYREKMDAEWKRRGSGS